MTMIMMITMMMMMITIHQADDQNNGLTVCPGAPSLPGRGPPALSRVNPIIHPTTIIVSIAVSIIIITTPPS